MRRKRQGPWLCEGCSWLKDFVTGLSAIALSVVSLVAIGWITVLLVQDVKARSVVIADVSVPKSLDERGYSPGVAASHLRDALNNYERFAVSRLHVDPLELSDEKVTILMPTVDVPLDFTADVIARFLGISGHNRISGEFTETGDQLSLRLRLNDQAIFNRSSSSRAGTSAKVADTLLRESTQTVFQGAEPFVAAFHLYATNGTAQAKAAAITLIDGYPASDRNAIMAHLLLGDIYFDQGDRAAYLKAFSNYRAALQHDRKNAVAHYDLGTLYTNEDDRHELQALQEYTIAGQLDRAYPAPHVGMGYWYEHDGEVEEGDGHCARATILFNEALAEYKEATQLDPTSAMFRYDLGVIDGLLHNDDWAIAEYKLAYHIDPSDINTLFNLADVYIAEREFKAAHDAYQLAQHSRPSEPIVYLNLGSFYYRIGRPDLAVAKYMKAAELLGRTNEAGWDANDVENLSKAIGSAQLHPTEPINYVVIGGLISKAGELDLGINAYQKAEHLYRSRGDVTSANQIRRALLGGSRC